MRDFVRSVRLEGIQNCDPCGGGPNCEQTLQAIIEAFPVDVSRGEPTPLIPRDWVSLNFCIEAVARVAACRVRQKS